MNGFRNLDAKYIRSIFLALDFLNPPDLVSGAANFVSAVLDLVRTYVEEDLLKDAVDAFCDGIGSSIGVEWPAPTQDIVTYCLRNYSDPSPGSFDQLKSLMGGKISGSSADDRMDVFDVAEFFAKFESEAIDGVVKKERCAEIATGCIKFASQERTLTNLFKTVDQKVADFNATLAGNGVLKKLGVTLQLKPDLVRELLSVSMVTIQGAPLLALTRPPRFFLIRLLQPTFAAGGRRSSSRPPSTCWI